MTASIRQAAGSLMIVGLSGTELTGLERAWLRLIRPSGVILFKRNILEARQTRALLIAASSFSNSAAMRCVDLEGGTVDRLRDAVAPMPSALAVANSGAASLMQKHGTLIAREAKAFGFNTTLAPVMDLALPDSTAVMGARATAPTPAGVVPYVGAFLQGLAKEGVVGCGKHFPGLGGGASDSHLETPAIDRSWKELWSEDIAPYRELVRELPMVMVTHASYPQTRSGALPATVSTYWVTSILRKRLGFGGLVFSDDLEMGGILRYMPIEEAGVAAIRAGIHMLEICHSPELILRCYEGLISEAERSATFRTLLMERAATAAKLRNARFSRPLTRTPSTAQLSALRESILRFADQVESTAKMHKVHAELCSVTDGSVT